MTSCEEPAKISNVDSVVSVNTYDKAKGKRCVKLSAQIQKTKSWIDNRNLHVFTSLWSLISRIVKSVKTTCRLVFASVRNKSAEADHKYSLLCMFHAQLHQRDRNEPFWSATTFNYAQHNVNEVYFFFNYSFISCLRNGRMCGTLWIPTSKALFHFATCHSK